MKHSDTGDGDVPVGQAARTGVTTIQITKAVRAQLCALGVKGESYNDILLRLLAQAAKKPKGRGVPPLSVHGG